MAENLLAPRPGVDAEGDALVAVDEQGNRVARSWDELRAEVGATAAALLDLGVGPGDRVVAWLPNAIETVVAMLGAASIGAVFSSTSPDFGAHGVLDRFGQIEPSVLFAADGYRYGGKRFDCLERLAEIRAGLPTLRATVVVGDAPDGTRAWDDFLAPHRDTPVAPARFAFDHPWYVLYSSGTTGVPKCIVHRAGGVLLQHLKEHQLHSDIRPGDRVMYFTTAGWMMWNWLVSTLASGATAVLFDGSPFHPGPNALFDVADAEQLSLLGVSAKFIDSVGKAGIEPRHTHGLEQLRTICSTGSPLAPEGFHVVYEHVKPDVHLASISGGTDLCGCLVGGVPDRPGVRRGDPAARPSAWRSTWPTTTARRSVTGRASRASWCAGRRSRRCRSASGATTTARGTGPRTTSGSPASGRTATTRRGPTTAASSSTAAATPR